MYVYQQIQEAIRIKKILLEQSEYIEKVAQVLIDAFKIGKKLLIFGNGGSAADAQHWAAEFSGSFYNRRRPPLPAIALTTNSSEITAIGNDFGFEYIFEKPLSALAQKGDIVMGISTSGNSKNVLLALETAIQKECTVIGFTGKTGGKMKNLCHYCFCIDSTDVARIQEAHELIAHLLCARVEQELFENKSYTL
ncbi:MAG: D-sedoheptulose 7-phosphate isomerase [Bacteroidia bacterium]|nr:D-sedoheptulose 7-phosphate isomerase [Bacteroidia bacterium]MDW8346842.1 D-sedoheptulose 7-phosphate isomerase [Bacteroidia bacterium]